MAEDIRFHCVHIDNERDAKKVRAVLEKYLEEHGIQAEVKIYSFNGEWIAEFQASRKGKLGDILEQRIERANIRWSGGGFAVSANMEKSWESEGSSQ